jgi:hypothetical protein
MKHIFLLIVAAVAFSASPLADTNLIQQVFLDVLDRPADPTALAAGLAFLASDFWCLFTTSLI